MHDALVRSHTCAADRAVLAEHDLPSWIEYQEIGCESCLIPSWPGDLFSMSAQSIDDPRDVRVGWITVQDRVKPHAGAAHVGARWEREGLRRGKGKLD